MAYDVHPDRFKMTGTTPKIGVTVHTSESGDNSAQSLLSFMTKPGDRLVDGSNPPRYYGSAYHAIAMNDVAQSYRQVLDARAAPNSAPPLNQRAWHICIPGRAAQTRDEWLDPASRAGVQAVAQFIVDKHHTDGFPLVRRSSSELVLGAHGYWGHVDVSYAWHQTNHTDPGSQFPWDVLAADIAELTVSPGTPQNPPKPAPATEDDMTYLFKLANGDYGLRGPGGSRRVSSEEFDDLKLFDRVDAKQVPVGSTLEYWIQHELAAYDRAVA